MSSLTTFRFDPKLTETIEQLKDKMGGASKSEVVRRAIALLKVLQEANQNGDEIVLIHKDQSKTKVIVS